MATEPIPYSLLRFLLGGYRSSEGRDNVLCDPGFKPDLFHFAIRMHLERFTSISFKQCFKQLDHSSAPVFIREREHRGAVTEWRKAGGPVTGQGKPTVSVIVPIYRAEAYLEHCVESIRRQTFLDIEIILVDDGSPDRCGEIADRLAVKDPRIRVVHKENAGVSAARNDGYRLARGEWILFVDADDEIKPHAVERMLSLGVGVDIVAFGVDAVTEDGAVIWDKVPRDIGTSDEKGLIREIVKGPLEEYCCAYLFRRNAVARTEWGDGPFVEGCGLYEDAWSLQRLLRSGSFRVAYLPESLYLYRQVAGSATHRHDPKLVEDGLRAIAALDSMSIPADIADAWHARLLQTAIGSDWAAGPSHGDDQHDLHARIANVVIQQARAGGFKGLNTAGKLKYLLFRLSLYRPLKRVQTWLRDRAKGRVIRDECHHFDGDVFEPGKEDEV